MKYSQAQLAAIAYKFNWLVRQDADGNLAWNTQDTAAGWRHVSDAQMARIEALVGQPEERVT